jgi:mono/diheme cytochrome c family protein
MAPRPATGQLRRSIGFALVSPLRSKLPLAVLAATLIVTVSGCDLVGPEGDFENGRELFAQQCGQCHILAEAGSSGNLGPDLDAAFADSRAVGMNDNTIAGVVRKQIAHPREPHGPNPEQDPTYMPADLVTGDDARDVAYYVGQVAGVAGIGPPEAPGGPGGQIFANNGCGNCHIFTPAESQGQVGPNLDEVLADRTPEEVEQAILDPDSMVTPGFEAGVMPAYEGQISPEDLELLVEFLLDGATGGNGGGNGNGG